jgi:SAM-dependent methyltransferase
MKIRESCMPEPDTWDDFFEPDFILQQLGLRTSCQDLVEFGCGYGTFTIPAARRITGRVYALDIDHSMIDFARVRAEKLEIDNIEYVARDFVAVGTGLPDGGMDYAMLFNILHHTEPVSLLREACRNLRHGGLLGIIHWIHDAETPRGPPMDIRPRPEQCLQWAEQAGFSPGSDIVALPPYHYGLVLRRD